MRAGLLAIAFLAGWIAAVNAQQPPNRGGHDPCIIKEGAVYYLFSTGRGLGVRRSTDLVHWTDAGQVFGGELPAWATAEIPGVRGFWAPDISFINGEFRLYYSVSTFGSWNSAIGLATNKTLDPASPNFRWVDQGKVIRSTAEHDDFNAIDPNAATDETGTPWLVFGSFRTGIKLIRLDRRTGKPLPGEKPVAVAARPDQRPQAIEAPFIVRRGLYYYLFVSFDYCCQGVNSTYKIAVGRATRIAGPYADAAGKPMLQGGGTILLQSNGTVRGPGHCGILLQPGGNDLIVHHYYDATDAGATHFQVRRLTWGSDGFPVVGNPLP